MNDYDLGVEERLLADYPYEFGVLAGYLPQDRDSLDEWLRRTMEEVALEPVPAVYQPSVQALAELIARDGILRMYVTEMIQQVPPAHQVIHDIDELLRALNHIVTTVPSYNSNPQKLNTFPYYTLFVYMMYTRAGAVAFTLDSWNQGLRDILVAWRTLLDSKESQSVLNEGEHGWLSPSAYQYLNLEEFIIPDRNAPHWGFTSYNALFHRAIKPEYRPIASPRDPKVIVSANDGMVYRLARKVRVSDTFWIKTQPYSLVNMLGSAPLAEAFAGGDVLQSFLSGSDFHRWHAPIAGTIIETRVIPGLMFSQLRALGFHPFDPSKLSQAYDACVNTRGVIVIESEDPTIGKVCVLPVGITEVSSVKVTVQTGQRVEKGAQLGYFSYGASTLCVLFQQGAIAQFTIPPPTESSDGPRVLVNSQIAIASGKEGS